MKLLFTWSKNRFLVAGTAANQELKFKITDTKLVLVVSLSTQDNVKPLKQLESGFKRTVNWNKYQSKVTEEAQNRHLYFLIDPSFHGVNTIFVLSKLQTIFPSDCEIKDYNVMKDPRNFSDQPVKNDLRTYDIIWKISIGQDDDYTTDCVLDYPYFKKYYKLIVRDLSKQQKLDADPKAIQQVHFTGNLDQDSATQMFFIIEKAKEKEMYSGSSWCNLVFIQWNKRYIYVIKKRWLRTKTDIKTI